jgi:hypothetical protein
MSISAHVISEIPLAAQPVPTTASSGKPPRKRRITAKADAVQQPEAR